MIMAKEFHIHIDASWLSPQFERLLTGELQFWRMDFFRGPDDGDCYAPEHHLTKKYIDGTVFQSDFMRINEAVSADKAMEGYIEGEFLPLDVDLPEKVFDPSVPIPFRLEMAPLPAGSFRETEVHVTLSRDQSDYRLRENLRAMGFLVAHLPKKYGVAEVFTAQGSLKIIGQVIPLLATYMEAAGGAVAGSFKEERIARSWVSGPDVRLAPVVERLVRPLIPKDVLPGPAI
jgi:hypothetical protein